MSNFRTLQKKSLKDISSQKWQFLAVVFLIFVGVSLFVGLYSSYQNIETTYKKFYSETNFEDVGAKFVSAPPTIVSKLKSINGVMDVTGRSVVYGSMFVNGKYVKVKIISISKSKVDKMYICSGSYPKSGEALMLKKFAELNKITLGEVVRVKINGKTYSFRISGLAYNPEYVLITGETSSFVSPKDFCILFVPKKTLEEMGINRINEVHIKLMNPTKRNVDVVINKVRQILKPYGIKLIYRQENQPSYKLLKNDLIGFKSIALMFPGLLLTISAMASYILLSRIVMEQKGVIAVLRALGYSKTEIILHYLSYAPLIGLLGSICGVIVGYFISAWMTTSYIDVLNLPYSVVVFHPYTVVCGVFAGVVSPLLAGFFTAKKAAEIDPAMAMRVSVENVSVRADKFLRRILSKYSILTNVAVKNLIRNPKRTAYTTFGIIAAVVLISTSMAFVDSLNYMFHVQFGKIQKFDYMVHTCDLKEVRSIKGVKEAYPIVQSWISIKRNGKLKTLTLVALSTQNLYCIYDINGKRYFPPAYGIYLPKSVADNLSISKGEIVKATLVSGNHELKVYKIFRQPLVPVCYMSLSQAKKCGLKPNWVIVRGGDKYKLEKFGRTVSIKDLKKNMEEMMGMMYAFFTFSVLFGALLSFAELFNMASINVVERRREFATLRMLGYTGKELSKILYIEIFVVGIVGLSLGFPLALLTLKGFEMLYRSDMFNMRFVIYPNTYVITVAVVVATLIIAIQPSIKYIERMDIAKISKEVE